MVLFVCMVPCGGKASIGIDVPRFPLEIFSMNTVSVS